MADEQYRWLDRETAELLLRGGSLDAVDAAARDQAERLAKTLEALTPEASGSAELPGEAAALAAFRAARSAGGATAGSAERSAARTADRSTAVGPGPERQSSDVDHPAGHSGPPVGGHDAGLVSIGAPGSAARRSRWSRPARFGMAAALAVGMVGGVAAAVTSGILPTPFGGDEPSPAVSAGVTPDRPLISPTPRGDQVAPTPDDATGGTPAAGTPGGTPNDDPTAKSGAEAGSWWREQAPSTCRDALGGKALDAHRRQALQNAAGGATPDRVWKYCKTVLGADANANARDGRNGTGGKGNEGRGNGNGNGKGNDGRGNGQGNGKGSHGEGNGSGGQGDQGGHGGDDEGNHIAPGPGGSGTGSGDGLLTSAAPLAAHTPAPTPTYTAL
ncbi:hypothetical protein [Streptomyces gilvus]|uniref:hypothetical protein n=1 Tax=Streptomyces gilvus TaxID=2920937 RepID=UPI001F0E29E9|nr:hypothetical protein [Streptomyces sp. CME 23]MCH5673764.1 hypothetical protein [Streptomyces sp. CME 23]